ncbi:MAG: sulfatase-like hydrolase/transferase [Planctomycetes bacterium]|nr:sulfatase-like hydrolase/transferase [Planctomycetota bacterium]
MKDERKSQRYGNVKLRLLRRYAPRNDAGRFDRREFLKVLGVGLAAAAIPGCGGTAQKGVLNPGGHRPNIVFILADDMGYGDVSCLNPKAKTRTPNIDFLARRGMRFTDAHSGSAVCTPTRYGVLTGRYSWRTRMTRGVLNGYSEPLIKKERMTVASLLQGQGYHTGCIGKWHLGLGWPKKDGAKAVDYTQPITLGPVNYGFDYFYGIAASADMPPYVYIENDRVEELPTEQIAASPYPDFWRAGEISPGFKHVEILGRLVEKAVSFIQRQTPERSFFLYLPLASPHKPVIPTKANKGKSKAGVYGDFVQQTDGAIGRVVEALKEKGLFEKTLIIMTSDNGSFANASKYEVAELGHAANYHFRGGKADIWDGGHRVPFVACWPGKVEANSVSDETICLTDLLATAAALTGVKLPNDAGEDSESILPALLQEPHGHSLREATVHHSAQGMFAIRQGKWKLIIGRGSGGRGGKGKPTDPPVQLYNMDSDVSETKNVQDKHPEVVEHLTALLERYKREGFSCKRLKTSHSG